MFILIMEKLFPGQDLWQGPLNLPKKSFTLCLEKILPTANGIVSRVKWDFFLQIWVVADKKGNPVELEFTVRNTDPVFLKMTPDRLFQIEQELKQLLKTEIAEDEHDIKNVKHIVMVSYQDLK